MRDEKRLFIPMKTKLIAPLTFIFALGATTLPTHDHDRHHGQ